MAVKDFAATGAAHATAGQAALPCELFPEASKARMAAEVGAVVRAWLPRLVYLHARLLQSGYSVETGRVLALADGCSIQALARVTRSGPLFARVGGLVGVGSSQERQALAMVLRTPHLRFLAVLNGQGADWSVHLRRFWDSMEQSLDSNSWPAELANLQHADLALPDALRLSGILAERFADDIPGVEVPRRLGLDGITSKSLFAGDKAASAALRWGDDRDTGFLLSAQGNNAGFTAVDVLGGDAQFAQYAFGLLTQACRASAKPA